jgi:hypothetical protein
VHVCGQRHILLFRARPAKSLVHLSLAPPAAILGVYACNVTSLCPDIAIQESHLIQDIPSSIVFYEIRVYVLSKSGASRESERDNSRVQTVARA